MIEEIEITKKKPDTLPPGYLVAERYRIISCLGHGGMGCVYLAEDAVLGDEQIAIKILHTDFNDDGDLMQRFLREVQLMRKVSHRNVVRTYDVGSDQNLVFFTMEYVPGRSMENIVRNEGFKRKEAANLIVQICGALEAIHEVGILHRDLKPGNILILEDGTVRITDFGVARPEVSNLTAHNEILGSVCYIAPEIWLGESLTPAVDLYSLGIVLYEFATGEVPFDGGSPAELMRLHLDRAAVPPDELNKEIPPWLNKLILKLLAKSPNERPRDAREIIDYVTLRAGDELPRREIGEEEKSTQDSHLNFMEELEKKSVELTSRSNIPVLKTAPTSEKEENRQAPHSRTNRSVAAQQTSPSNYRKSKMKNCALSLRSVVSSFFVILLLLSGARSILSTIAPLPERNATALLNTLGIGAMSAYSWSSVLVPGLLHALLFLLVISLPVLLLAPATRSWSIASRLVVPQIICTAVVACLLCVVYLMPAISSAGTETKIDPVNGLSLVSSASMAAESLVSLTLLSPFTAKYSASLGEYGMQLGKLSAEPLRAHPWLMLLQFLYLALCTFLMLRSGVLSSKRKKTIFAASALAVYLLILTESLFFPTSTSVTVKNYLLFDSALPLYYLLSGMLHWIILYIVAAILVARR